MNKKAIQETFLALIMGVIIFILLLGLTTTINDVIRNTYKREICRLSIVKVELAKTVGPSLSIDCPMQTIDITKGELPKDAAAASNYVKRIFAQTMYDTWYVAGRGEHRRFQQRLFQGGNILCLIYARINFADDIGIGKAGLNDMKNWLTANHPKDSTMSYFTYITFDNKRSYHILDASDPKQKKEVDEIDPAKNYYIVFWSAFKHSDIPLFAGLGLGTENFLDEFSNIWSSLSEENRLPQVAVIPEDQFESLGCEGLLN